MCGEQTRSKYFPVAASGSPPRVRGTADLLVVHGTTQRITPACAGNRMAEQRFINEIKDHPRVCGEQACIASTARRISGSPPRVRGTGSFCGLKLFKTGITPACAGNRRLVLRQLARAGDHPRVCGEQSPRHRRSGRSTGSPPRVRGTGQLRGLPIASRGITPACAGNSPTRACSGRYCGDHPRVCGEQIIFTGILYQSKGSPPRVRGTGS